MKKNTWVSRPIIGNSRVVQQMLKLIERVANSKTNVLITGESGTGKELVARMIHDTGPLSRKPFVPVNCGAIPENLIESEMFGHKRGSFTGAVSEKMGLFEVADGGTLFLDEVGELPLSMQVKLLRAIQERLIKKVGGTEDVRVDVRMIAATNRDLEAAVAAGQFREDLYYRLNVILIKTPPLREREGDIRILAEHFLKKCGTKYPNTPEEFDPEVIDAFDLYDWPGNVRELENVIERAVALQGHGKIGLNSVTPVIQSLAQAGSKKIESNENFNSISVANSISLPKPNLRQSPVSLDQILSDIEKIYVLAAFEQTSGSEKESASLLGVSVRSLRQKFKKFGIL